MRWADTGPKHTDEQILSMARRDQLSAVVDKFNAARARSEVAEEYVSQWNRYLEGQGWTNRG